MKNIHITLTHFEYESRVLKEIKSLLKKGIVTEVVVLAFWRKGLKKSEYIEENIKVVRIDPYMIYIVMRVLRLGEISFYKMYNALLSWHLRSLKPDIVNFHHVNALGVVGFRKMFKDCLFIYDTHELETETLYSIGKLKVFRQKLERKYIPLIDYTFVVTPSIENWYRETYQIDKISTIMNVPFKHGKVQKKDFFREKFAIEEKDTIFLYNGSLFNGRGIQILLEVFEKIPDKSNHIVFMGTGELEGLIAEYEDRNSNIHFKEAVAPSEVIEYTAAADVGFSLIQNACLSYYYCLPNKIFEYTMAEIPMIVSNMKDMSSYVLNNNLGMAVDGESVDEITQSVEKIASNKSSFSEALLKAKEIYNWEVEEEKMIKEYQNLLR